MGDETDSYSVLLLNEEPLSGQVIVLLLPSCLREKKEWPETSHEIIQATFRRRDPT